MDSFHTPITFNFTYDPRRIDETLSDYNDRNQAHLIAQTIHLLGGTQATHSISWDVKNEENADHYTITCTFNGLNEISDRKLNSVRNACPAFVQDVVIRFNDPESMTVIATVVKTKYFNSAGKNRVVEFIRITESTNVVNERKRPRLESF